VLERPSSACAVSRAPARYGNPHAAAVPRCRLWWAGRVHTQRRQFYNAQDADRSSGASSPSQLTFDAHKTLTRGRLGYPLKAVASTERQRSRCHCAVTHRDNCSQPPTTCLTMLRSRPLGSTSGSCLPITRAVVGSSPTGERDNHPPTTGPSGRPRRGGAGQGGRAVVAGGRLGSPDRSGTRRRSRREIRAPVAPSPGRTPRRDPSRCRDP
jgi:hypothetical protein